MSQIKISGLPEYTGNTTGVYVVMNNSGETETFKVTKETLIGASGTSGTSGTSGASGSSGSTGTAGTSGTSGVSGSSGTSGTSGTSGVSGSSGTSGTDGTSGSNGTYGSSGTSGTSGSNGTDGTSGSSGVSGTGGTSGVININSPALGRFLYTNATGTAATASVNLVVSGSNVVISGSAIITGSVLGNINALSISSNTASLNLNNGNFFTLQLVSGSTTFLNPTNIKPGQTANILVSTINGSNLSFPSSIKQVSCSVYIPTQSTGKDIITLATFDSSSVYLVAAKNLV